MADIEIIDNTDECIDAKNAAVQAALEAIGLQAEGYAKMLCPVGTPESTGVEGYHGGVLRNSIAHAVDGESAVIGTNISYGAFVELGTGIYASNGNGRPTPWVWIDENGKAHRTAGMKPRHFLKNAVADHTDEYKAILESFLNGKS